MHTGVLWVICVFFGHGVARYRTCTLQVSQGSRTGTQEAPVDSIRAWEHQYVQFCGNRAGLGISVWSVVQGLTGSGEDRECTLGLYLPSQTRLCDIWPVSARKTTNWPSMGTKSLVAHCLKVVHAQPSAAGYTAQFKILRNIVRTHYECRVVSHMFTQAWTLRGP